jgi:hypothetical protein
MAINAYCPVREYIDGFLEEPALVIEGRGVKIVGFWIAFARGVDGLV